MIFYAVPILPRGFEKIENRKPTSGRQSLRRSLRPKLPDREEALIDMRERRCNEIPTKWDPAKKEWVVDVRLLRSRQHWWLIMVQAKVKKGRSRPTRKQLYERINLPGKSPEEAARIIMQGGAKRLTVKPN